MKNEINVVPTGTSVWKKVLIVAVCVLSAALAVFAGIAGYMFYDAHRYDFYSPDPVRVSERICMEYGIAHRDTYVRLKDMESGKYTTPRLDHIFINEYNSTDSLVVFRTTDEKRGYVNIKTGKIIVGACYDRAWNYSEGIGAVMKGGEISFLNTDGEPAFAATFPMRYRNCGSDIAFQFHQGLCVMRTLDNKWGMINTQGEWVVEPVYNSIDAPMYGFRRVTDGEKYGLLSMSGEVVLPVEYELIRQSSDGRGFILAKDGYAREVDKQLKTIIPFVHDGMHPLSYVDGYKNYYDRDDEYVQVNCPRYWRYDIGILSGVMDCNGKVIIPALYFMIRMVSEELFEVEVTCDGDRVLMNAQGQYVGRIKE